jgi:nitrogenase molybdenum-iron protein beta chain
MTQNADHVLDHFELFRGPEYQQMLANKKKMFENPRDPAEVERIREWAKTPEYREKNFAREALTVNPAKACQPLGAVFAAVGFEGTIPSFTARGLCGLLSRHLSRLFKARAPVFHRRYGRRRGVGGLNNMIDSLNTTAATSKPKMIAVHHLHGGSDRRRPQRFIKTSKRRFRTRGIRRPVRTYAGLRR